MTLETQPPQQKRIRLLYAALIASLALNLLFIGGFVAAAWHHGHRWPKPEPGLLGFVRQLPPDRRDVVGKQISAARDSMKEVRANVRMAWREANALLTAEPFDKEKFKAALTHLADVEAGYKAALNDALAETAAILTPEERKLFQSWREKRRPRLLRPGERPGPGDEARPD